jgi:hypothetical protein
VWDDRNGNGVQDPTEPGIAGVRLRMVDSVKFLPIDNIGDGSTCHSEIFSDTDGLAKFVKCPKHIKMRVQVMNAPPGSINTSQNAKTTATGVNDDTNDSDLRSDMLSDEFYLGTFNGAGAYGQMDLGFLMPKTLVARVWNDKNKNGLQDDGEEGIKDVTVIIIVDGTNTPLPDQKNGGNAHLEKVTGLDGRVTFTKVPQGVTMKLQVTKGLPITYKVTLKGKGNVAGGSPQLDSNQNANGITDSFKLPNNVDTIFDLFDMGYYV